MQFNVQCFLPGEVMIMKRSNYILLLLTLSYLVGEMGHFLLGATSREIARDIGYGDKACFQSENGTISTCRERTDEESCKKKGNDNVEQCRWDYTGLGMDYQVEKQKIGEMLKFLLRF